MFEPSCPMVSWWGLGAPIVPGRLPFGGGVVDLEAKHIRAWIEEPEGVWQADAGVTGSGAFLYRLVCFHSDRGAGSPHVRPR